MKRFTLTRGSEVLAEGVVWNDGTVTLKAEDLGDHRSGRTITVPTISGALAGEGAGVSIVWIDETHEAKSVPQFDIAKHRELMAEWRERNDGGDCGRVANELARYIDEELVPVEGGDKELVAHQKPEPTTPIECRLCGGDGSQGRPFCSSPGCAHRSQVKVEQMRQAAERTSSYDQLRRTVAKYCPSLVGFLPPVDAATPVTKADLATSEYVREQATGVDPKDARGKTPTERALALMDKRSGPLPFGGEAVQRLLWATLSMLDERLGRAP